jgi:hypothetical protein
MVSNFPIILAKSHPFPIIADIPNTSVLVYRRVRNRRVYRRCFSTCLNRKDKLVTTETNNAIEQIRKLETEGTIETLPPKEDDNGPSAFTRFKKTPQPKPQQQGAVPPVGFKFDPRLIFTESGYCVGYKDE